MMSTAFTTAIVSAAITFISGVSTSGHSGPLLSEHLPKSEVDSNIAGQHMLPVTERSDSVISETGGTAPNGDIAVFDSQAAHGLRAVFAAPQKHSRKAQ